MARGLPDEPDYTCPLIDEVLGWMDDFDVKKAGFSELTIQQLEDMLDHYQNGVSQMHDRMEEIRSANDALRQRSQYFAEEYEKVVSDLDDRNNEVEGLRSEVKNLEQQLEDKG